MFFLFLTALLTSLLPAGVPAPASLDKTGTLYAPYLEWSFENPGHPGNPFDLIAAVTFKHPASGETHTTQMFYAGGDTWKFRFTATRTGQWTFATRSPAPALDGHTGRVEIHPNPDPNIKGFLVNSGNKFAYQAGEQGELQATLFNICQSNLAQGVDGWHATKDLSDALDELIYHDLVPLGCNAVYPGSAIANRWFNLETAAWDEHDSDNPDLRTFEVLEQVITHLHARGIGLHIWAWGDEERRWTPVGRGGVNGETDRRLQRYIAARLGPLPGWTMSYGFDLGEKGWIGGDTTKLDEWAAYMQEHMGWPHLLFARGYAPERLSGLSYSSNGPGSPEGDLQTSPNGPASFEEVAVHIDSDRERPHLYEERFIYLREFRDGQKWTMDRTRRVLWWNAMAGGVGAFWGVWDGPGYPHPEQMRTHALFWQGRFELDMERANKLTDGYALRTPANDRYVFYKENTRTVEMDLSSLPEALPAVAVDSRLAYSEISLGELEPGEHTWQAPYRSDWAIAVGRDRTPPAAVTARVGWNAPTQMTVTFSEPLDPSSAAEPENYAIDKEIRVLSASLEPDGRTVRLATTAHARDERYVLTVTGVRDLGDPPNAATGFSPVSYTPQRFSPPPVCAAGVRHPWYIAVWCLVAGSD